MAIKIDRLLGNESIIFDNKLNMAKSLEKFIKKFRKTNYYKSHSGTSWEIEITLKQEDYLLLMQDIENLNSVMYNNYGYLTDVIDFSQGIIIFNIKIYFDFNSDIEKINGINSQEFIKLLEKGGELWK